MAIEIGERQRLTSTWRSTGGERVAARATSAAGATSCSSSIPSRSRRSARRRRATCEENLSAFADAETDVVLVSCDSAAARQAWKKKLGLTYTVASDFWPHGAAARAYGVFDEATARRFAARS